MLVNFNDSLILTTSSKIKNVETRKDIWEIKVGTYTGINEYETVYFPRRCLFVHSPRVYLDLQSGLSFPHKYVSPILGCGDYIYYKTPTYIYKIHVGSNKSYGKWKSSAGFVHSFKYIFENKEVLLAGSAYTSYVCFRNEPTKVLENTGCICMDDGLFLVRALGSNIVKVMDNFLSKEIYTYILPSYDYIYIDSNLSRYILQEDKLYKVYNIWGNLCSETFIRYNHVGIYTSNGSIREVSLSNLI